MNDVAESRKLVCEFLLVVVEERGVRDDDDGDREAESIKDGSCAWICTLALFSLESK